MLHAANWRTSLSVLVMPDRIDVYGIGIAVDIIIASENFGKAYTGLAEPISMLKVLAARHWAGVDISLTFCGSKWYTLAWACFANKNNAVSADDLRLSK